MTKDNIEIENKINDFKRRIKQLENLKISKDFLISQGFTYHSLETVLVKKCRHSPTLTWFCEVGDFGWNLICQGLDGNSNVYEFKKFKDLKRFYNY